MSATLLSSEAEGRRVAEAVEREEARLDGLDEEGKPKQKRKVPEQQFEGAAGGTLERATMWQRKALEDDGKGEGQERYVAGWGRTEPDDRAKAAEEEQVGSTPQHEHASTTGGDAFMGLPCYIYRSTGERE